MKCYDCGHKGRNFFTTSDGQVECGGCKRSLAVMPRSLAESAYNYVQWASKMVAGTNNEDDVREVLSGLQEVLEETDEDKE